MKKVFLSLISLCVSSVVLPAQSIPDLTQDETAKYVLTLSGTNIGNVCFSDSVFTKIGDITIHIKLSNDYSTYWYQKYGLNYFKEHLNVDASNSHLFEDIKPFSFKGYRDAQERYSQFTATRVKGIQQYTKYKSNVEELLANVSEAGGVEKLFILSSYNSPVYFTSYKKTLTPYLHTISTSVLNVRQSQDSRILRMLREEIAPTLSCFSRAFDKSIKYYGLSYTYASDNVSGGDIEAIGETISIIAPAKYVIEYRNLSITQEDFLRACELFYVNNVNKEVRKISYDSLIK